jgi:hypothetical protein
MGEVVGQRPWPVEDHWPGRACGIDRRFERSGDPLIVVHCFKEKMQRVSRRGAWREGASEADDLGVSEPSATARSVSLSHLNLSATFITMKAGSPIRT